MILKHSNFDLTLATAKEITTIAKVFQHGGELDQLTVQIHPIIDNMLYHRVNDVLETERLKTLCKLARVLTDEEMEKVYDALRYKIS